jgi:ribosome modulation factor
MSIRMQQKPPRYNIDNTAWLGAHMTKEEAFLSGYKHGYEGWNSPHICPLTRGSEEQAEWIRGYKEGTADCDHPWEGDYPTQ